MKNVCKALALLLAYSASYSYSETIYGITANASSNGLNWVMSNVLPQQAGLQVNTVIYQYTANKDPSADMLVHVQNENAQGDGYIFRETDDWSGLPGNTINKIVAVNDIPIQLWGNGSIEVEGDGSISDPNVLYTYKYDPCYDPQSSPACPGYIPPIPVNQEPDLDVYDALNDEAVLKATEETDPELFDRDGKNRRESQEVADDRLEQGLAASENALNIASGAAQDFMIASMANQIRFDPYYTKQIAGGVYVETVSLPIKDIPDNKRGLRNGFAQQVLHEQMVKSQYK
jgi:hypothetical protein